MQKYIMKDLTAYSKVVGVALAPFTGQSSSLIWAYGVK